MPYRAIALLNVITADIRDHTYSVIEREREREKKDEIYDMMI